MYWFSSLFCVWPRSTLVTTADITADPVTCIQVTITDPVTITQALLTDLVTIIPVTIPDPITHVSKRHLGSIRFLLIIHLIPWLYELSRFLQNYINFAFVRVYFISLIKSYTRYKFCFAFIIIYRYTVW